MLFNLCANWNETRGTVFNKKNTNLLHYAIQLVCLLKWNKMGSFQKNNKKNLLLYAIQLVCILKWTRGIVFKKTQKKHQFITVCYSTRGAVFKKQQFINVWYSTCVRIEMKQDEQFSKK